MRNGSVASARFHDETFSFMSVCYDSLCERCDVKPFLDSTLPNLVSQGTEPEAHL